MSACGVKSYRREIIAVIKENLERCRAFYRSDFYQFLKVSYPSDIDAVFTVLCMDPDAGDKWLYQQLGDKFQLPYRKDCLLEEVDGHVIRLAADIVCGRQQIVAFHDGDVERWLLDYERVRTNINWHFLWPKHKAPTINTYRYTQYLDRIDCLLYDLKLYFSGEVTPMALAYQQEVTAIWLKRFRDFQDLIDTMALTCFVDASYQVLDIARGQQEIIDHLYTRQEIKASLRDYMCHLLELNAAGVFV